MLSLFIFSSLRDQIWDRSNLDSVHTAKKSDLRFIVDLSRNKFSITATNVFLFSLKFSSFDLCFSCRYMFAYTQHMPAYTPTHIHQKLRTTEQNSCWVLPPPTSSRSHDPTLSSSDLPSLYNIFLCVPAAASYSCWLSMFTDEPPVRTGSAPLCRLLFSVSLFSFFECYSSLKEVRWDSGELQSVKPQGLWRDDLTDCVHRPWQMGYAVTSSAHSPLPNSV